MYSFKVEDADDFLTPRVSQGAAHALKLCDEVDEHMSTTDVHGLTTSELVALHATIGKRLADQGLL